jgi:hypothetical protein
MTRRTIKWALPALLFACACTPANSPGFDAKAVAGATVETMATVWDVAAQTCVAAAVAAKDDSIRSKCAAVLTPVYVTINAAAQAVDTWSAVDQKNFPCMLHSASAGIRGLFTIPGMPPAPVQVAEGLALADAMGSQCVVTK